MSLFVQELELAVASCRGIDWLLVAGARLLTPDDMHAIAAMLRLSVVALSGADRRPLGQAFEPQSYK
ncbi:hypothetical protein F441_08231 [Phytophthora nicotianae CJ01A1]|uniref:Uncharacterized protein n=5 Tax=Phytophthora nicotianae TaxID=4792 RepID=W2P8A9_PHYN3|nr:hypothetical protein PPTG_25036 [Phytophthora nicotianae INRA-310]ETI47568.1 hypothetical protein F443_08252 [Phytophthora nicotianae P1569]ETK87503.1 hypothetical protein L915_08076 [Phytophthora nicotianae]ETP17349.1 hypothetical protein F441_08231 [Phytophthora nicotianae CJ01A1]ETP45389.1 hypothetical protein F442_08190 [Phytophthora nicotianae P10297]ETL40918.1 hypothetical protein L916_07999 [Phytophthora nicotianae]